MTAEHDADRPPTDPERPIAFDVEPTVVGRIARWTERARILGEQVQAARARHASVDVSLDVIERDSTVGGGLLAGALAYRLFIVLLPTALLLVSGLGLYADSVDKSTTEVVEEAGLTGVIASEVAATASGSANWVVFLVMLPVVAYAIAKLYRAIAIANAIIWHGSGRGVRTTPRGVGIFTLAFVAQAIAIELLGWLRREDGIAGFMGLLLYVGVVAVLWLFVSRELPSRDVPWPELLPGALLFGVGLWGVNLFNVYFTTRMVEGRADTYGALGVAAALLFSLVIVGRVMVVSAALNASLADRRAHAAAAP